MLPATLREFGRGTHFLWNNLAHDLAKMQEVLLESATVDVAGENAALPTTPLRPGASIRTVLHRTIIHYIFPFCDRNWSRGDYPVSLAQNKGGSLALAKAYTSKWATR